MSDQGIKYVVVPSGTTTYTFYYFSPVDMDKEPTEEPIEPEIIEVHIDPETGLFPSIQLPDGNLYQVVVQHQPWNG